MKKLLVILLILSLLFCFTPAETSSQKKLRIVTDRDYPPFTFIDEKGHLVGVSVDFWNLWSKIMGVEVELIPLSWEVAQEELREGKADAIDTIFKTKEREKYLDFSSPIFHMTSSIYYNTDLKGISSLSDITPYVVGIKEGDALVEVALSQNKDLHFRFYKGYGDIVKSAVRREIDVFIMDDIPAHYYLVKYDLLYKFSKTEPFTYNNLYTAVLKGNSETLNLINEGISKIKREEMNALTKRYLQQQEAYPQWLLKLIVGIILGALIITVLLLIFNRILNSRLKKATQDTLRYWRYFEGIFEISTLRMREEDFFEKVLELSLQMIPKAKAGSVFKLEEGNIRLVKTLGHSKEIEGTLFNRQEFLSSEDEAIIIKEPLKRERYSPGLFEKLQKYCIPIKESLGTPIKWQDRVIGYLSLDILIGSKDTFDTLDMQIIDQFGKSISVFYAVNEYIRERERSLTNIISVLVKTLEYYDISTQGHSERVAKYALKIAEELGFDSERMRKLYWACLLHDIGKIYIPQDILNKKGRFTKDEYEFVKIHSTKSEEILSQVDGLKDVAEIVRYHHERWDGMGYPDGLSDGEIPLESRIIGIADAFEAMTSERPYKRVLTLEEAIEEIKRCKGTQFDPDLADIFVDILEEELQSKHN
ncbi:MAG TPA: transporter substrate-binding domain-containing protein [Dictyoglomaceae bacterium]|nr:transporter substrate-binding domain-containing protein [Dictyoglomaceae bacterium]HOL39960.1 transporter substrate-binding domain-containing protein [Dictyoglomaceae bacterium]HPP16455.1 transporter substrate-binding domain-containing protein [Dictyoglomaceae bacterium]HPU43446.1 transporter substrate-binding domain-containing protein [Dictyoglomaceae bacterium]